MSTVEDRIKAAREARIRYEEQKVQFQVGEAWNWPRWMRRYYLWMLPYLPMVLWFLYTAPHGSPQDYGPAAILLAVSYLLVAATVGILIHYWPV
jgi:hypothetical protein